jgi:hypothetical protein
MYVGVPLVSCGSSSSTMWESLKSLVGVPQVCWGVPYDPHGSPSRSIWESQGLCGSPSGVLWESLMILMGVPLGQCRNPMASVGVPEDPCGSPSCAGPMWKSHWA